MINQNTNIYYDDLKDTLTNIYNNDRSIIQIDYNVNINGIPYTIIIYKV